MFVIIKTNLKKEGKHMKRKGFLKKMIAALCVGALISMPVTVSAAGKEDVVGEWTGGMGVFIFYEDGQVKHVYNGQDINTFPCKMESGSLTVTNKNTGNSETVSYNLWRAEDVSDIDKNENAVLYKIIESGKMQAWNVVKEAGSGDWTTGGSVIMTKITENKKADADSITGSDFKCEHYYEWKTTVEPTETADGISSYMCRSCGDVKARQPISADVVIRSNLLAAIKNAEAGTTVTFDSKSWLCYPQYVLDALKEKGNISLKTDYTYEGIKYSFTIPAGSDYTNLEQADFYGFMYLFGAFNGIIVE